MEAIYCSSCGSEIGMGGCPCEWANDKIPFVVVFGPADPEQQAAEKICKDVGIPFAYAAKDGKRCHPGNAYQGTATIRGTGSIDYHGQPPVWMLFECDVPSPVGVKVVRCDHHRSGDPGYGKSPAEYWEASSLGQLVNYFRKCGLLGDYEGIWAGDTFSDNGLFGTGTHDSLSNAIDSLKDCFGHCYHHGKGVRIDVTTPEANEWRKESTNKAHPKEVWDSKPKLEIEIWCDGTGGTWKSGGLAYVAAADHCLSAAYRGECPGVDPDALMQWRAESRAEFQKRPVKEVLADVEAARKKLREALYNSDTDRYVHCSICNGQCDHPWGDARPRNGCPACVNGFSMIADLRGESIPELPEAAARENIPFLAQVKDRDGREKISLMCAKPEMVERFLAGEFFSGEEQLVDMYGDPARGFAGGYINR